MKREFNAQQATTRLLALVGQTPTDDVLREAVLILAGHVTNEHVVTAAKALVRMSTSRDSQ